MKLVWNYLIFLFCASASAFTSSTFSTFNRAQIGTRKTTAIGAAAKTSTKSKKKKRSTKKKAATKTEVETVRKAEFVSKIADKTGLTKADSEAALSAVLDTITEVSSNYTA